MRPVNDIAYVASLLTSLIATCAQAGVNALEYLVALQDHRAAVFAHPAAWLLGNDGGRCRVIQVRENLATLLSLLSNKPLVQRYAA
jgi:hypothetical protein